MLILLTVVFVSVCYSLSLSPSCSLYVQHEVLTDQEMAEWMASLSTVAPGTAATFGAANGADNENSTNIGALLGLTTRVAPLHDTCGHCKGTHASVYKVIVGGPTPPRAKRSALGWGENDVLLPGSVTTPVGADAAGAPNRWIPVHGAVFKPSKCHPEVELEFVHPTTTYAEIVGYRLLAWLNLLTTPPTIWAENFHIPTGVDGTDNLVCSGSLQAWVPGGRGFLWSKKEKAALSRACIDDVESMYVTVLYWIGNWDMNIGGRLIDENGAVWAVDNSEILVPTRWRFGEYPFLYRSDPDGPNATPSPGWANDESFPLTADTEFVKVPKDWPSFAAIAADLGISEKFADALFVKRTKLRGNGVHVVRDWHGGVWVQRALTSKLKNHTIPHPLVVRHMELLLNSPSMQEEVSSLVDDIPYFSPDHLQALLVRARELVHRFMAVVLVI
jgi:hypothetical protein